MKKYEEMNNLILKSNKMRKLLVLAVLVLTLAMATGCGKKKNKTPTPTTPSATVTKEETTSEVTKPTESTPVETTETVPETEDVESIDLSQYSKAPDCINALQSYDTLMIIVWKSDNGGGQTILKNGDHYNNSMLSSFYFNRTPENGNIKDVTLECNDNNADIMKTKKSYGLITVVGEDVEYKVTFTYNDGTEETITVYITEDLAE